MSGYKRVSFYELCRLCASNNQKDKTHIFQEEGRKIQLQNKIQICLSLNVYENDFLPKVVCNKCLQSLETCYTFQQECVGSETMLSTYFRNFRWTEDFKKSGKVYIKDTKPPPPPPQLESPITVPSTTPTTTDQIAVTQTAPDVKTVESLPYYTLQLPTIVTNPNVITKNPTKADLAEAKIISTPTGFNVNTLNLSGLKASTGKTNEILSNVVVNSNGEVLNISQLYTDFDSVINQVNGAKTKKVKSKTVKEMSKPQQETIQLDEGIIKIDLTDATDKPKYTYKVDEDKNQTVIYTPITEQTNFNTFSATNSLYSQSNINVVQESSTINLNILNQGMTDLNQGNFRTNFPNIIQNETIVPPTLKSEEANLASTPNKSHVCDVCRKSFKRREHLYQHVKLHTGFRPYRCETCNKAFMRKEHLLRHMTLHSGQKNYTCNICEKNFSRRDNLLKHKKTHEKQSNFTCEICQKQFVMKHYYTAHRLTHGEKFQVSTWDLIKT